MPRRRHSLFSTLIYGSLLPSVTLVEWRVHPIVCISPKASRCTRIWVASLCSQRPERRNVLRIKLLLRFRSRFIGTLLESYWKQVRWSHTLPLWPRKRRRWPRGNAWFFLPDCWWWLITGCRSETPTERYSSWETTSTSLPVPCLMLLCALDLHHLAARFTTLASSWDPCLPVHGKRAGRGAPVYKVPAFEKEPNQLKGTVFTLEA
jgi:hypothetical protein